MKFLKVIVSILFLILAIFFIRSYIQFKALQNQRFKSSLNLLGSSLLMYFNEYQSDDIDMSKLQNLIKEQLGGTKTLLNYLEKEKEHIKFIRVPDSNLVIMYNIGPDRKDDSLKKNVFTYFELSYWQFISSFDGDIILSWAEYIPKCERILPRQCDEYYFNDERVWYNSLNDIKNKVLRNLEKSHLNSDSSKFLAGTYKKALIMKYDKQNWKANIECESPEDFSEGNELICSSFINEYEKHKVNNQIDSAVIILSLQK